MTTSEPCSHDEIAGLLARLEEAEETLRAIRGGEVEALVVQGPAGPQIYRLESATNASDRFRGEMLAQISDCVIACDREDRVIFLNAAAERQYGVAADEALGRERDQLFHCRWALPEDETEAGAALNERGEWRGESIHMTGDGREMAVESSVSVLRDAEGFMSGSLSVIRNITERKRTELAQERLAAIIHSSEDAIVSKTLDGIITSWNPGAERMFGYTAGEIVGNPVLMLIPPERIVEEADIRRRIGLGMNVESFETVRVRKDGRRLHAAVTISPIRDGTGRVVGASKIARDISRQKKPEENLRRSEEIHRVTFDFGPMGVVYLGTDGRFLQVNQKYCDITGYSAAELLGRTPGELTHPEDVAENQGPIQAVMNGQADGYESEKRYVRKDGSICWVHVTARLIFDAQGQPLHAVGMVKDITARKASEAARKSSEEHLALGIAVAGLALSEIDYKSGLNHLSAEVAQLFGLGQEALVVPRAAVHATFHPEDLKELEERIAGSLDPAGAGWFVMDHRVVWPDGQVRWLRVRKQVIFEGEGAARRPVRGTLAALDVTVERNATEAVRRSEVFVRGVLNSLPEHVVVLDRAGVIVAVNEPWENFARENGAAENALSVGVNYLEVCRNSSQTGDAYGREALAALEAVLAGERESCALEYPCHGPQGERWFLMHAQRPLYAEGGLILGHVDITLRVQAEQAIRDSELRLRLATETSAVGIWEWNLHTNRILWDAEMFRIYGVEPTPDGFVDYTVWSEAVLAEDLAHSDAVVEETVRSSGTSHREFRIRRGGGQCRFIEAVETVRTDEAGRARWVVGTNLDVTERKVAEEQILRLNAELELRVEERTRKLQETVDALQAEMVARRRLEQEVLETSEREQRRLGQDLHDDLGQQLAGVGMLVHLLNGQLTAEAHPGAAKTAELVTYCKGALETARSLAKSFYPVELEMHGLMIALEDLAQRTEKLAGLRCETKLDNGFRAGKEASIHLYRIVQESIGNAIKHGQARHIVIEGRSSNGQMSLSVSDDGLGFPVKETAHRTGIGLHIFQYRARLIGAELKVQRISASGGCRVSCVWGEKLPRLKGALKSLQPIH